MIIKLLRFLIFPIAFKVGIITLQTIPGNLYSYPIIIYLTFQKKTVRYKYINGKSMNDIIEAKAKLISVSMIRHMKREPLEYNSELYYRYQKWCQRQINAKEIEDFIKEYNLNVNTDPL